MVVSDKQEFELRAHLLRRAGFGSTRSELQKHMENSYEDTVEYLLAPNFTDWMGDYIVRRFDGEASGMINAPGASRNWLYRMISAANPLTEKIPLLWHSIFATGVPKVINGRALFDQINMLRKYGPGRLDDLLLQLSKDPAMELPLWICIFNCFNCCEPSTSFSLFTKQSIINIMPKHI